MNKLYATLFLLGLFWVQTQYAQSHLNINYSSPPTIDGVLSDGEWDKADTVVINAQAGYSSTVMVLHDSMNLYFAFLGNLESKFKFPEVLLDIENDKSANWNADDWWFHVSATDCESQAVHSDYTNCKEVQPDWEGVPNMSPAIPGQEDTVEIRIPFSKIGLILGNHDTIGLALDITNTFSEWDFWPASTNIDSPSTFANAILKGDAAPIPTLIQREDKSSPTPLLLNYPNPFKDQTQFTFELLQKETVKVAVYDLIGKPVKMITNQSYDPGNYTVIWKGTDEAGQRLPASTYFCRIEMGDKVETRKWVLSR